MKNEKKTKQERCVCPYCEEELATAAPPYCQPCGVAFHFCQRCQITVLDREAIHCPNCGEPLN